MKMPDDLAKAFNDQIVLELESSLAYLQMAAYFEYASLKGLAAWMRVQSEEEHAHAMRFFDYVLDRGNAVTLGSPEAPPADFDSPLSVFRTALSQEQKVSESISTLYAKASQAADVASFPLLQWFLTEQVEEESTVSEIIDQLELIADDGAALLLLDRELGTRTTTPAE